MRKWQNYNSDFLNGEIAIPEVGMEYVKSMTILLHGRGSNEQSLKKIGELLEGNDIVVSLRGPIAAGENSFTWYHTRTVEGKTTYDYSEITKSLDLLDREIKKLARTYKVSLKNITLFGFSQGSILTMAMALKSNLQLGNYLCFSGRTLPEIAEFAKTHKEVGKDRRVFVVHGTVDDKINVEEARVSAHVLDTVHAHYVFREFEGGHEIQLPILQEAMKWMKFQREFKGTQTGEWPADTEDIH